MFLIDSAALDLSSSTRIRVALLAGRANGSPTTGALGMTGTMAQPLPLPSLFVLRESPGKFKCIWREVSNLVFTIKRGCKPLI